MRATASIHPLIGLLQGWITGPWHCFHPDNMWCNTLRPSARNDPKDILYLISLSLFTPALFSNVIGWPGFFSVAQGRMVTWEYSTDIISNLIQSRARIPTNYQQLHEEFDLIITSSQSHSHVTSHLSRLGGDDTTHLYRQLVKLLVYTYTEPNNYTFRNRFHSPISSLGLRQSASRFMIYRPVKVPTITQ